MHSILQDLRYSIRQLIKSPGFTLTAIVSLALGIGATTAVFSVIYAALINPYPYPTANRIVRLSVTTKDQPVPYSIGLGGDQVKRVQEVAAVQSVLAMDYHAMTLSGGNVPQNIDVISLISNGFDDLGMPPLLGRGLVPSDAPDGQDPKPVALISYQFWRSHFLSNPGVLGKTLQLDHKDYVIVGVAAPRFAWYRPDVWIPLKVDQGPDRSYIVDLLLKPGVSNRQADAAIQPVFTQFARETPKQFPKQFQVQVEGLNAWVVRSISGTLFLLLGAVATLLAIGCGNVSILLLARGSTRQHELAVRAAVGASRRRILRQLLTESLLLSAIGAALGVGVSYGMLAGIKSLLPQYAFAPEVVININLPVLFVSIAIGLATGVIFGLWPALQLSRGQTAHVMASGTRRVAGNVSGRRSHSLLIAGQIALTLLLVAAAGSTVQEFLRMVHKPLGYDPHNVISVQIPVRADSYPTWSARAAYFEQLRTNVAQTPGVAMAAISSNATPPNNGAMLSFEILGEPPAQNPLVSVNSVGAGYFAILRIPLLQGRVWTDAETAQAAHVAVINRTFANRYFPKGDAIGQSVRVPELEESPPNVLNAPGIPDAWLPVIGVVEDALNDGMEKPVDPAIFLPYTLNLRRGTQVLVRSNVPPLTLVHAIQQRLAAVNPEQQIYGQTEDLERWISDEPEWQDEHLAAWAFGIMSWLALVLAAIGLYSVVSYTVAQRTNEFGIRMALGAQPENILRIVFASIAVSVGGGLIGGLVLTLALNRILAKWIEGNSHNPLILFAGVLLLAVVAIVASLLPARHASRIDPMSALREN